MNSVIDLALFKKICFNSGMPLVVVDLFCYLTGVNVQVKKGMKLLKERVSPKRKDKVKKVKYGKSNKLDALLAQENEQTKNLFFMDTISG